MINIIPAIDLIDGCCVRLEKGAYNKKTVYSDNPVEMAMKFEKAGFKYLHLVDLDGAKKGSPVNFRILKDICSSTSLLVDFSGGLRQIDEVKKALDFGADKVTIGSMAVKSPNTLKQLALSVGYEKIILGADVYKGYIATHGWQKKSEFKIFDFIKSRHAMGFNNFMCTDVEKDGMLSGPNTELYTEITNYFPDISLIASGGVSVVSDITELQKAGILSVIVGKALYNDFESFKNLIKQE